MTLLLCCPHVVSSRLPWGRCVEWQAKPLLKGTHIPSYFTVPFHISAIALFPNLLSARVFLETTGESSDTWIPVSNMGDMEVLAPSSNLPCPGQYSHLGE